MQETMNGEVVQTGPLHIDLPTDFTYNPDAHIYAFEEKPPGFKHLDMSGARSREEPHPEVLAEIENVLDRLEAQGLYLTQNGFEDTSARATSGVVLDVRAVQLALADIPRVFCGSVPLHLNRVRICHTDSSDALKDDLERYRENRDVDPYRSGYISNGDFIMAMILSGFKFYKDFHRNDIFKCCSLMQCVTRFGVVNNLYSTRCIEKPKYDLLDY